MEAYVEPIPRFKRRSDQRLSCKAEAEIVIPERYLGTNFKIWTRQRTWFWFVASPQGDGGIIGTAASEAEAISDARRSSESVSRRNCAVTQSKT